MPRHFYRCHVATHPEWPCGNQDGFRFKSSTLKNGCQQRHLLLKSCLHSYGFYRIVYQDRVVYHMGRLIVDVATGKIATTSIDIPSHRRTDTGIGLGVGAFFGLTSCIRCCHVNPP